MAAPKAKSETGRGMALYNDWSNAYNLRIPLRDYDRTIGSNLEVMRHIRTYQIDISR